MHELSVEKYHWLIAYVHAYSLLHVTIPYSSFLMLHVTTNYTLKRSTCNMSIESHIERLARYVAVTHDSLLYGFFFSQRHVWEAL